LNSGAEIIESGENLRNDNSLASTRSENRKPICAIARGELRTAAALIVTLAVLLLTVFAPRQIVAGLTTGAVKGG
jgi:ABC-type glycerol-3-phosphate transport system permease component